MKLRNGEHQDGTSSSARPMIQDDANEIYDVDIAAHNDDSNEPSRRSYVDQFGRNEVD